MPFIPDEQPPEQSYTKPTPSFIPDDERTVVQKVGDVAGLKNTVNNLGTIANFAMGGTKEKTASDYSTGNFNQAQELTKRAKLETDPVKKKVLLDQARGLMESAGNVMNAFSQDLNKRQVQSGITEKDLGKSNAEFALRRGVGQSAELASWLLPFAKEAKVVQATRLGRVAQAGKLGATQGSLQAFGKSVGEGDSVKDIATNTLKGGAIGGVTGIAVQGVFESPGAIKDMLSKASKTGKKQLIELYKNTLKQNIKDQKFYKQYGGLDKVAEDAIEMGVPPTKDGLRKYLVEYGKEYGKIIDKATAQAEAQGKKINIASAYNRARVNVAQRFGHDATLQKAGDAWFEQNANKYINQTSAKVGSVNNLRKRLDAKVGDLIAGDINVGSDAARKAFATELRNEFKKSVNDEARAAITKYQLLSGLSEAMQKEPLVGVVESGYGLMGALASPHKLPGAIIGTLGGIALRSPGLKRKLATEFSKNTIKPSVQKAGQSVGNILSPFTASMATKDEN